MALGIVVSANSIAYITGEKILDMNSATGNGIGASGKSSTTVVNCTFTNNAKSGIYAVGAKDLLVERCTFTNNIDCGIRTISTSDVPGGRYLFNSNEFNLLRDLPLATEHHAIYHERSFSSNELSRNNEIHNNVINVNNDKSVGAVMVLIYVNAPNGGEDSFPITLNTLNISSTIKHCDGILVRNDADGYDISNNTLTYSSVSQLTNVSATLGIWIENVNGTNNRVNNNTVLSNFLPIYLNLEESRANVKCGLHFDRSKNLVVCGNVVDECYRGVHFSGDLRFCDFALNDIGSALYGIIATMQPGAGNTHLGKEFYHQNRWVGNYFEWGALYNMQTDQYFSAIDQFWVDETLQPTPGAPNHHPPTWSPVPWFGSGETVPDEESSMCIMGRVPPPTESDYFDEKEVDIIKGNLSIVDALDWDLARRTYRTLMISPELRPLGSDAGAFYDIETNSSFARYAKAEQQYQNAFVISEALESQVFGYSDQVRVWADSLAQLAQLEAVDTSSADPILQAKMIAVLPQLVAAQGQRDAVATQAEIVVQNALLQTQLVVNTLPSGNVYESNLKTWLLTLIKRNTVSGLDSTDYAALKSIANQCPNQGGEVVTKAPWMMLHQDMITYLDENYWAYCDTKERQQEKIVKEETLELVPNPALDRVSLHTPSGFGSGTWQLMDLNGRSLTQGTIATNHGATIIDLTTLPVGIYLVKAQSPTGRSLTIKLVHQN